mmetsp:Transcript_70810/g.166169  ORF Transcript_70810/g.166169 Transcript_70810/m.166169 type:complete len:290 (-) Transcript_70810:87-956(-)
MRIAVSTTHVRREAPEEIRELFTRHRPFLLLVVHHECKADLLFKARLGKRGQSDDELAKVELSLMLYVKGIEGLAHGCRRRLLENLAEGLKRHVARVALIQLQEALVDFPYDLWRDNATRHQILDELWARVAHVLYCLYCEFLLLVRPLQRRRGRSIFFVLYRRELGLRLALAFFLKITFASSSPVEVEIPKKRWGVDEVASELSELDGAAAIWIHQPNHLLDFCICGLCLTAKLQRTPDIRCPNLSVAVKVNDLKGDLKLIIMIGPSLQTWNLEGLLAVHLRRSLCHF